MVAPASRHMGGVMPSLNRPAGGADRPAAVLRFPVERAVAGQARAAAISRHPAGSGLRRRPAPQPAPLRLTRRGRVVVAVLTGLLLLGLVAAGVVLGTRSASAGRDSAPLPVTYRTVLAGETLWGIAGEVAPGADRRDVVAELVELNALPGARVSAGQRLAIPTGEGW
jgi:hypothetical protein